MSQWSKSTADLCGSNTWATCVWNDQDVAHFCNLIRCLSSAGSLSVKRAPLNVTPLIIQWRRKAKGSGHTPRAQFPQGRHLKQYKNFGGHRVMQMLYSSLYLTPRSVLWRLKSIGFISGCGYALEARFGTLHTPWLAEISWARRKARRTFAPCATVLSASAALIKTITLSLNLKSDLKPDTYIVPKLTLSLTLILSQFHP